jgi:hypothetical protein
MQLHTVEARVLRADPRRARGGAVEPMVMVTSVCRFGRESESTERQSGRARNGGR